MGTTALLAGSAGAGALGSIQQGYAQAGAAKYNAAVAEQNAQLATQNAQWTGAEGEQQAAIAGLQTQATAGAQKTRQAANNVDVNSGSAAAVRAGTAEAGQLNQMNIRSNAARQAYGFETQAAGYEGQAALDKSQASQDVAAGFIGAGTKGLTGAALASEYGGGGDSTPASTGAFPQGVSEEQLNTNNTNAFLAAEPSSNYNYWQMGNSF